MKTFKPKIGYGILIPVLIILVGCMILAIITGAPTIAIIIMGVTIFSTIAFTLHIFFGTIYWINDKDELLVKCGLLFHSKIEISKIKSISRTRNIISSPAPSMDRIELNYRGGSIILSPKDKIGFANELTRINPDIQNYLN